MAMQQARTSVRTPDSKAMAPTLAFATGKIRSTTREIRDMNDFTRTALSKVPQVTLVFWIIKIAATTLGETGGDSVTMTLNWGYLIGTGE